MSQVKQLYLEALTADLDNNSFKGRFLQEMSDHFDDSVHEFSLGGNRESEQDTADRLGDPKKMSQDFNSKMRRLQFPHFIRDIILIILASSLALLVVNLIPQILINNPVWHIGLFENRPWLENIYTAAWIPIQSVMMMLFFWGSLRSIQIPPLAKKGKRWVTAGLLSFPALFLVFDLVDVTSIAIFLFQTPTDDQLISFAVQILLPLVKYVAILVSCGWLIQRSLSTKIISNQKWVLAIPLIFGGSILALRIILGLIDVSTPISILLLMPFELLDFIFLVFSGIILGSFLSITAIAWVDFILMVALSVLAGWQMLRFWQQHRQKTNPRFPWLAILVEAYSLSSLLLPAPPIPEANLNWHVPAVVISDTIEHQKLNVAYSFTKRLHSDEGRAYYYSIQSDPETGGFIIDQNSGQRFFLKNIQSVNNYSLTSISMPENRNMDWTSSALGFENPEVECKLSATDGFTDVPGPALRSCLSFSYQGQVIYTSDKPWPQVNNMETSVDGKWALIHFHHGAYDPSGVVLVQLN